MLYRHCYVPSFPAQVFMIQLQNVSKSLAECYNPINTHFWKIIIPLIHAPDIVCFSYRGFFNKNSGEVDIAPAFGEITTACNVGQAKKGHGACLKSGQRKFSRLDAKY